MEHRGGGDVILNEEPGPVALAQRSPFRGFASNNNNKRQTNVSKKITKIDYKVFKL